MRRTPALVALARTAMVVFSFTSPCIASEYDLPFDHTYGELLRLVGNDTVVKHLKISREVRSLHVALANDAAEKIPVTVEGIKSGEDLEGFFEGVREYNRKHDRRFQEFFEEALLPAQAEGLLGCFIAYFGAEGLLHKVVVERLKLTDSQQELIRREIEADRQRRREGWRRIDEVVHGQGRAAPRQAGRSIFDLRSTALLKAVVPVLDAEQKVELVKLLAFVPADFRPRISFDW
jgi:hypothetical protein